MGLNILALGYSCDQATFLNTPLCGEKQNIKDYVSCNDKLASEDEVAPDDGSAFGTACKGKFCFRDEHVDFGYLWKMVLQQILAFTKFSRFRVDDDVIDKLNYRYTTFTVAIFAIIIAIKQYLGNPIQCWVPAQFTDAWEAYTENYCWIQNKFYDPLMMHSERRSIQTSYYQWIPFILALQACYFYLPCLIWRLLNWQTGIHFQGLIQMACDYRLADNKSRQEAVDVIATQLGRALYDRRIGPGSSLSITKNAGGIVKGLLITCLYLIIKSLYVATIYGQLHLMDKHLGRQNESYGLQVLHELTHGIELTESDVLPRLTFCDFEVRVLGNVYHHTVQCVLPINMLNEKIFTFLYFWYCVVMFVTCCGFFYWFFISFLPCPRINFVRKHLLDAEGIRNRNLDAHALQGFTTNYLRHDGILFLRMTATHADELMCTEIMKSLWTDYCERKEQFYI